MPLTTHTCLTIACDICQAPYLPDDYTPHFATVAEASESVRGTGWTVTAHGCVLCDEEHGTPTEVTESATDDPERPGVDTESPGVLAGHQEGTESPDVPSDLWARHAEHGVLLSQTQPDVLLDAVRPLLRATVEREMSDTKQAWTESDLLGVERDRALHFAIELDRKVAAVVTLHAYNAEAGYCEVCADHGDIEWPCATVRALNPQEEP